MANDKKESKKLDDVLSGWSAGGHITCRQAFDVARQTGCTPSVVGEALDAHRIRIEKCQLGLFGYEPQKKCIQPADEVIESLQKAIEGAVNPEGRLECRSAWQIADALHIPRMSVAAACESLKIKIGSCQLGAF